MRQLLLVLGMLVGCAFPAFATPLHLVPIGPAFACRSIAHAPHCVVVNAQGYEVATTLTIPNTFTAGTVISSSQMNANFSSIGSWANGNITDSNIGAGGIKPLHIICSGVTADCTFGGGTTAQTYIFNPANTGIVPLLVTNAASPTADYLDVTANGGGAGGVFKIDANGSVTITAQATASPVLTIIGGPTPAATDYVDVSSDGGTAGDVAKIGPNGNLSAQGVVFAAPTATPTASAVWCQNDNGAVKGLTCNIPTSSTNGYRFKTNLVNRVVINSAGNMTATVDATNNVNLIGVIKGDGTNGGANSFAQARAVSNTDGSVCHNAAVCTSVAVGALFTNETGCGVSNGTTSQQVIAFMTGTSGSYTVYWYNVSGGDITGGTTFFADVICAGY